MIELGRWNGTGYTTIASWGYDEEYDETGLIVSDDNFYSPEDFPLFLYRWGSYGAYRLIFAGDAYEQVPELAGQLLQLYDRWG